MQINFQKYIEKSFSIPFPILPLFMLFLSVCNHFNISCISFLFFMQTITNYEYIFLFPPFST